MSQDSWDNIFLQMTQLLRDGGSTKFSKKAYIKTYQKRSVSYGNTFFSYFKVWFNGKRICLKFGGLGFEFLSLIFLL